MIKNHFLIKNTKHKTYPNVIHANNLRERDVKYQFDMILQNFILCSPIKNTENDLSVITATNIKTKGSLEISLRHLGFSMEKFYLLGEEIKDWDFVCKFKLISDALKKIKTNYVMFCDSHDVIVIFLNDIIEKFKKHRCKMLVNAEYSFWPNEEKYILWNELPLPDFIECKEWEEEISKNEVGLPMYLNSGVWIAEKGFLKEVLESIEKKDLYAFNFEHSGKIKPNDQPFFREAFKEFYPYIILDYKSNIFQTTVGKVWKNNRWNLISDMKQEILM